MMGSSVFRRLFAGNNYLRVDMADWYGQTRYATYTHFVVLDEKNYYRLIVSGFSGNVVDDMAHQVSDVIDDMAHQVGDVIDDMAHQVGDVIDDMAHQVGDVIVDTVYQLGDVIEDMTQQLGDVICGIDT